jgi:aspartyl-tRNA(Asn)/glutamyl-tRNA(Gln) amidotransferase subunit B
MTQVATTYEAVIGLEVHAQLLTASKMFCSCSADYAGAPPNTHVCPVCLGLPGVLPVINRAAVEKTIMTALALHCEIPPHAKFDRKNYPYPDLMKGYQISQYDLPLSQHGWLAIELPDGTEKRIGITRVHLEEDTAMLRHEVDERGDTVSLVDINRSGVPLMEIVSEPDMRSPEEARLYLVKLRQILRYIGASKANMEEGNFRCDANISLRPAGSTSFGTKVEIKNMNSFRSVFRALEYEIQRQAEILAAGGTVVQETRGWQEHEGRTVSQRSKEYAHDYRYFPEPDLPPLDLSREFVESIRARLPELPDAKRERFMRAYGLSAYEANLLTESPARADYYERAVHAAGAGRAKAVANWMLGEMARLQNITSRDIEDVAVRPEQIAELIDLVESRTITSTAAKTVFERMFETGGDPRRIVEELGLTPIGGDEELLAMVDAAIAANPKAVADYRAGKTAALQALVGQVMKQTRGRANPERARELLVSRLDGA